MEICRECYSSDLVETLAPTVHPIWGKMMSFWRCNTCGHEFIEAPKCDAGILQGIVDRLADQIPTIIEGAVVYKALPRPMTDETKPTIEIIRKDNE